VAKAATVPLDRAARPAAGIYWAIAFVIGVSIRISAKGSGIKHGELNGTDAAV
jgi:hypothetical protein